MHDEELYHFGIKGQKWGVRRFQNKDGSLTPEGKKRYDDDGEHKSLEQKHKERLIAKYRDVGVSEAKATKMAEDRIRGEKILLSVAAVTVTAATAYGINKHIKDRTDQIIKAGDVMQRIEAQDTGGKLHEVFYTSKGKHDDKRYENMLGYQRKMGITGQAYMMKLRANGDVKVASKKNAMKAFEELYKKDPEFRDSVKPYVKQHIAQPFRNRTNTDKTNSRNIRKMYENFNSALIDRNLSGDAGKKFYDSLKAKGYGAVQDINDMKFSGYNARNPLIIFDNSKKSIMVESVKDITNQSNYGKYQKELNKAVAEGVLKKLASPTAAGLTTAAATVAIASDHKNYDKNSPEVKYAQNYIKKHPNTDYTIDELRYMYRNGYR